MSYAEICNDDDFKNYLKKKNYQDAIDYIYSGHSHLGSSLRDESIYGPVVDVLKRYYDLDLDIVKQASQNDCDSVKNARSQQSVDRRKYYNKENSEFFCKSNKEFDDYYKRNIAIFYEATKTIDDNFFGDDEEDGEVEGEVLRVEKSKELEEDSLYDFENSFYHRMPSPNDEEVLIDELYGRKNSDFSYNTMPERRISPKDKHGITFDIDRGRKGTNYDEDESELASKYQTYPLKRKSRTKNYKQLLKYCEKSLANYSTTVDIKLDRWCHAGSGSSIISNDQSIFCEKSYQKVIKSFVRLRGFESVENYVQYHYGRILDKSFDSNLKLKLREALGRRDEQLVISRPILKTTTQSSVVANNRLDSLPPPYTSLIENDNNYFYKKHQSSSDAKTKRTASTATSNALLDADCFKHYDYIDVNYKQSEIDDVDNVADGNELLSSKQQSFLFKFVEDMHDMGINLDEIVLGQHDNSFNDHHKANIKARNYCENNVESENVHDVRNNQINNNNSNCCYKIQPKINHAKLNSEMRQNENNNVSCNDNIYESIENNINSGSRYVKAPSHVVNDGIATTKSTRHHHHNQLKKEQHHCCKSELRRRRQSSTVQKA